MGGGQGGILEGKNSTALDHADLERMHRRLRRSGIPSRILRPDSRRRGYAAQYRVKVSGLAAASVSRLMTGGSLPAWESGGESRDGLEENLRSRLEKAAVRTLYTLGSDSGEVVITVLPGRRYAVDDVKPRTSAESGARAAQAGGRPPLISVLLPGSGESTAVPQDPSGEARADILMGMDPEFVLVNRQGLVIEASRYLDRFGSAGCDPVRTGEEVAYPLAELRPEPRSDPDGLLKELRRTLLLAGEKITDRSLAWKAGALPVKGLPLGGHLHFSGVPLSLEVLQCLDNYLALPMMLLEDPAGRARRPRYGWLGDFRRQSYGGFEYRTLPSFLVSPFVAKTALYLAYIIVRSTGSLRARPLNGEHAHRAYYEGRSDELRRYVPELHRDLRRLQVSAPYLPVIDKAFGLMAEGRFWDENRDIRPLWNVASVP